jgi:hypothetical protein
MSTSERAPIACSLAPGHFAQRADWIARLNAWALRDHRRDGLSLHLTYDQRAVGELRELVRREQACCGFLRFDMEETAEAVRLTITAPPHAGKAAEALLAYFTA